MSVFVCNLLTMDSDYIKCFSTINLKSYNGKLTVSNNANHLNGKLNDHYSIPATEWICDTKKLPYIT